MLNDEFICEEEIKKESSAMLKGINNPPKTIQPTSRLKMRPHQRDSIPPDMHQIPYTGYTSVESLLSTRQQYIKIKESVGADIHMLALFNFTSFK